MTRSRCTSLLRSLAVMLISVPCASHALADLFIFDNFCQDGAYYGNCFDNDLGLWRNNWGRTAANQNDLVYPGEFDDADINGHAVTIPSGTTRVNSIVDSAGTGELINNRGFLHLGQPHGVQPHEVLNVDTYRHVGSTGTVPQTFFNGDATIGTLCDDAGSYFASEDARLTCTSIRFNNPFTHRFEWNFIDAVNAQWSDSGTVEYGTDERGALFVVTGDYEVHAPVHAKDGGFNPFPELIIEQTGHLICRADHEVTMRYRQLGECQIEDAVTLTCESGGEVRGPVRLGDGARFECGGAQDTNPFSIEADIMPTGPEQTGQLEFGFGTRVPDTVVVSLGNVFQRRNTTWQCWGDATVRDYTSPGGNTIDGNKTGMTRITGTGRLGTDGFDMRVTKVVFRIEGGQTELEDGANMIQEGASVEIDDDATLRYTTPHPSPSWILSQDAQSGTDSSVLVKFGGEWRLAQPNPMQFFGTGSPSIRIEAGGVWGVDGAVDLNLVSVTTESGSTTQIGGAGCLTIENATLGGTITVDENGVLKTGAGVVVQDATVTNRGEWISIGGANITNTAVINHDSVVMGDDVIILNDDITEKQFCILPTGSLSSIGANILITTTVQNVFMRLKNDGFIEFRDSNVTSDQPIENNETGEMTLDNVQWTQSVEPINNRGKMIGRGATNSMQLSDGSSLINESGAALEVEEGQTAIGGAIENDGRIAATSGATMTFEPGSAITGAGTCEASEGSVLRFLECTAAMDCLELFDDGKADIEESTIDGVELVSDDDSCVSSRDSDLDFAQVFLGIVGVTFEIDRTNVQPGNPTTFGVRERFTFGMTDETSWFWGPDAVLALTGGVGAPVGDWDNWTHLEVGGEDLGDEPQGYDNNFDLSILRIDPGAHAMLEDLIDNGNRTPGPGETEALYVDTLEFADADGRLNLNGINIYYKTLIGDEAQIIDVPVSTGEIALLTDVRTTRGTILGGGVADLLASDDSDLHTRSGFGSTFIDLHSTVIRIDAVSNVPSPSDLDLLLEERIDESSGLAQVRLRNWTTANFDFVNGHGLGQIDQVTAVSDLDGSLYIGPAGEIELELAHIVFVPFFAFTFESEVDWVEMAVE